MRSPRIVVVGSSNTDMIIQLQRIPRVGETLLGGDLSIAAGGKGANQAVSAARAGGKVTFIARLGKDLFGDQAIAGLARNRIDVDYVCRDPRAPSGVALIMVAENGENIIAVAGGANRRLSPGEVKSAESAFAGARALLVQLETPLETVKAAVRIATKTGGLVILNPAPAQALPDALLRHVSVITPNETEAELLTGVKVTSDATAAEAAAILRARGVQTVVITLGQRGAFVANETITQRVPGFCVTARDTTAAGDVFNGSLAVALSEGQPLSQAVRFANAAAAVAVTRLGAQPSAPTRLEIEKCLRRRS